jgi:hypothetical protein
MNVRQWKRLMSAGAILTGMAAGATLLLGVLLPVRVPPEEPRARRPASADEQPALVTAEDVAGDHPSLPALRRVCSLDLRRPLYDAPPEKTPDVQPPAAKVPLAIRLLGTVQEPGHSMAMVQTSDGMIEVYAEGDRIDDAGSVFMIMKIEAEQVTIDHGGRSHTLTLPKPPEGELR